MSLPASEPIPMPEEELSPARRRRMRRLVIPEGVDEQADVLDDIGKRATPGAEFYLSSLLAGAVAGLGFVFDSPALIVLAVLLAPFMGPAVGVALATVAGSASYFVRSLTSLVIAGIIFLLTGTLAGWAAQIFPPRSFIQAGYHLSFSWTNLILLSVGTVVTVLLMARSAQQRPQVSSVAIAYGVFLPLSAAGFGLTSGAPLVWEGGLLGFLGNLVWMALCGTITLALLGMRPLRLLSYVLIGVYALACLTAVLLYFLTSETPLRPAVLPQVTVPALAQATQAPPTAAVSAALPSATTSAAAAPVAVAEASLEPSLTLAPLPTASPAPTRTLVPTRTPTITVTPEATPIWARINAKGSNGAYIRTEPQYDALIVISLLNGNIVEVLDEVQANDGATWVKVRTPDGKEGWIVRALLATATPAPGW